MPRPMTSGTEDRRTTILGTTRARVRPWMRLTIALEDVAVCCRCGYEWCNNTSKLVRATYARCAVFVVSKLLWCLVVMTGGEGCRVPAGETADRRQAGARAVASGTRIFLGGDVG